MAKFGAAYGLCPLIDNRSLLGATVDSDENCVIVTIGKNIVSTYKFQDQKLVSSWSTKDKLTSCVEYDKNSLQYIAIFNHDQLRTWKCDDQLDKVKKYKFQKPLHSIITDGEDNPPLVLFRDGYVLSLPEALESRKNPLHNTIIGEHDTILEYKLIRCNGLKYIIFISSSDKDTLFLNIVSVATKHLSFQQEIKRHEDGVVLVGYVVMPDTSSPSLFTLWSDGSLFSYQCLPNANENFPGVLQQKIVSVNTKHPVALSCICNKHIVLFGADPTEEGATLVLLNLQYQIIQSRLHFKLYTTPPRLWNVNSHLLVAMGCNLIAVPYKLEAEHLSSLVGTTCTPNLMDKTIWLDTEVVTPKPIDSTAPATIKRKIQRLCHEGYSLGTIVQNILPELIEKKDTESLLWAMNNFSDIPENCLVQILNFCLSEPDTTFPADNSQTVSHYKKWKSSENGKASSGDESVPNEFTPLRPKGRVLLVERALNVPFSDVCLMPHLRSIPFTVIITLLTHLCYLMDHEDIVEKLRVVDWISLLVDSHYQEYLLCRDENVTNLLSKINTIIHSELSILNDLDKLSPVLNKINAKQLPLKVSHKGFKMYSIDTLRF